MTTALYLRDALRDIESELAATLPKHRLMILAAQAIVDHIQTVASQRAWQPANTPIAVLCGPGNNGGDGALVACALHSLGYIVSLVKTSDQPAGEMDRTKRMPADAAFAWKQVPDSLTVYDHIVQAPSRAYALIVDALFGIGLDRALQGINKECVLWANRAPRNCLRLAIDVPSGLNIDTGTPNQGSGVAFKADQTISFIGLKFGYFNRDGLDLCGQIFHHDLGACEPITLERACAWRLPNPGQQEQSNSFWSLAFAPLRRASNTHKGSFGGVAVIGGATSMLGAAALASNAALMVGAGRVWLGSLASVSVLSQLPEIMVHEAKTLAPLLTKNKLKATVLALGPGLGQSEAASRVLHELLVQVWPTAPTPEAPILVLDADALNLLSGDSQLQRAITNWPVTKVLTPHPLEAARLLNCELTQIQNDRLAAVRTLSGRFKASVVLKGNSTLICHDATQVFVMDQGTPALATGGTGDVLTGLLAGLLAGASHLAPAVHDDHRSAHNRIIELAVCLHANAASAACAQLNINANVGLKASELTPFARELLNQYLVADVDSNAGWPQ
jgi:ADP-dependent NAD(P)H-hydrate dehydratase / NAD(P)H-hydrate epimerase